MDRTSEDDTRGATIGVLVVTMNRAAALRALLQSLAEQTQQPEEVVVVDNASSDETAEMLRREFPRVRLLQQDRNLGCIEGRNAGMAACSCEIVVCLDDDATCGPETVAQFARAMAEQPRAAVIAARVVAPNGEEESVSRQLPPHRVFRFSGGAAALRKRAFLEAGGYPGKYERGVEELDLAWRVWGRGREVVCYPEIAVRHPVHRKSGPIVRYQTRNEIWTGWRNLPLPEAVGWALWKTLFYPARYLRRGWAGWALLGVVEGWRGIRRERKGSVPVGRETWRTYRRVGAERRSLQRQGASRENTR